VFDQIMQIHTCYFWCCQKPRTKIWR